MDQTEEMVELFGLMEMMLLWNEMQFLTVKQFDHNNYVSGSFGYFNIDDY
jgi:hypothetical protein